MKRLSLEELKAQKAEQVKESLEAVKGGNVDWCHVADTFWKMMEARAFVII